MELERIKNLSEKREGGLKKLAVDIGMSEQNLHRCIRNNKIQASDLEKISQSLGVSIVTFFDEKMDVSNKATATNNSVAAINSDVKVSGGNAVLQERVKLLEQLLEEKERTIKILMSK